MDKIRQIISNSISLKEQVLQDNSIIKTVNDISSALAESFRSGKKLLICGNGGSAADAQHLAAEFSGRFYYDRPPLNAEALHVNTSYLTAVANDYSYNDIYSRMIKGAGNEGDVLWGISTSGNSENVVRAMQIAKEKGMKTVGFTGEGGGKMESLSDFLIAVPSKDTPRVQEVHILIGHIICELVEAEIFPR